VREKSQERGTVVVFEGQRAGGSHITSHRLAVNGETTEVIISIDQ
jgi:hypothetical protein